MSPEQALLLLLSVCASSREGEMVSAGEIPLFSALSELSAISEVSLSFVIALPFSLSSLYVLLSNMCVSFGLLDGNNSFLLDSGYDRAGYQCSVMA